MNELKERLARLAETPGPRRTVDAPAVIAKGRRVRRRRRWTAALAAAGLAAAVAVPVVQVTRPDEHRPRVVEPVRYPDVLVETATFGWLPRGYARTRISRGGPSGGTFELTAGRGPGGGGVTLTLLPPGLEPGAPTLPGARPGTLTRAEPIHGRRADWLIEPGAPGSEQIPAEFRFQYRDGAWAVLQINGKEIADVATVRRIAENVRFDGAEPAKFPVRIENLPQGMRISGARVEDGVARAAFTLAGSEGGELMITVGPTTEVSLRDVPSRSNTTIDGHPAFDSHRPHDGPKDGRVPPSEAHILNVYDAGGVDVGLDARGRGLLERLEPTGGLTGLYRRITWLGPDESAWTTTPLG